MQFIQLPILSKTSDPVNGKGTEVQRDVIFPISSLIIDDWTESDNKTPVPNKSKVQVNGAFYKIAMGKGDLLTKLQELGAKIFNTTKK